MGETYTSTRPYPEDPIKWSMDTESRGHQEGWVRHYIGGAPYYPWMSSQPQTTTSYRTGRRAPLSRGNTDDDVTEGGGNAFTSSVFQSLAREAKDDAKPRGDTGHEFLTKYSTSRFNPESVVLTSKDGKSRYVGPLVLSSVPYAAAPDGLYPTVDAPNLSTYGTEAIRRTVPTRSPANLARDIAELIQRMPEIPVHTLAQLRGMRRQEVGNQYLNIVFGWQPTVESVRDTAKAFKNAKRIIRQYENDSGKIVRRGMSFPTKIESSSTVINRTSVQIANFAVNERFGADYDYPNRYLFGSDFEWSIGKLTVLNTKRHSVWFRGAYSYHLPVPRDFLRMLAEYESKANRLLGTRITPEVLWELAPWSWLADWKFNLGGLVSNWTKLHSDGLVIRWGYLMSQIEHERTFIFENKALGAFSNTYTTVRKERIRASPYGFGVDPGSFSLSQWAILGALGMTKGPSSLNRN